MAHCTAGIVTRCSVAALEQTHQLHDFGDMLGGLGWTGACKRRVPRPHQCGHQQHVRLYLKHLRAQALRAARALDEEDLRVGPRGRLVRSRRGKAGSAGQTRQHPLQL
jgi:hypothetical protein